MVQPAAADAALPRIVTKTQYAAHRGCSASYISKLIRQEKLRPPALRPDERIDRILADAQIAAQRERPTDDDEPAAAGDTPAGGEGEEDDDTLVALKKETERERHRKLQRENDEAEGRLVSREKAEREQETAARATRDALFQIPARIADRLATIDDPARIRTELRAAIEQALADASTMHDDAAEEGGDEDDGET